MRAESSRPGRRPSPTTSYEGWARSRHHCLPECLERLVQLAPHRAPHLHAAEAREAAQLPHQAQLDLRGLALARQDDARDRLAQEAVERRLSELLAPDDAVRRVRVHAREVAAHRAAAR